MFPQTMYLINLLQLMTRIHLGWQKLKSEKFGCKIVFTNIFRKKSKNLSKYNTLEEAFTKVSDIICEVKLLQCLPGPINSTKTYQPILNTSHHSHAHRTEVRRRLFQKANHSIKFFPSKCTPLNNSGSLHSSF